MLRLKGRLNKLEQVLVPAKVPQKRIRVLVDDMGGPVDLTASTCTRTLRRGTLLEIVELRGNGNGLSDEELESFIESFPIQHEAAW